MSNLFEPAKLGALNLKNRVIMAPLSTNFPSVSGEITPEFTAFYLERARGGVGMIIVEWANVDYPLGKGGYTQMRLDDDCYIPSLCQFTEIIHETGAKVCLQLNHSGGMFGDRGRSDLSQFLLPRWSMAKITSLQKRRQSTKFTLCRVNLLWRLSARRWLALMP